MQRQPATIDDNSIRHATYRSSSRVRNHLKIAERIESDEDREQRKLEQTCKCCWYFRGSVIAGAAMTSQPCGICKEDQMYGSTATDPLCLDCAKKHNLCKSCGGKCTFPPVSAQPLHGLSVRVANILIAIGLQNKRQVRDRMRKIRGKADWPDGIGQKGMAEITEWLREET